jgi:hypothetical protein
VSKTISDDTTNWFRLLSLAGESDSEWLPEDLANLWRHKIRASLQMELTETLPEKSMGKFDPSWPGTFEELVKHPSPPLELLKLVKNMAKARRVQVGFPSDMATALYHAAIAVALARHGVRITELDDAALSSGFQWTIRLPWLDQSTRQIVEIAINRLLSA